MLVIAFPESINNSEPLRILNQPVLSWPSLSSFCCEIRHRGAVCVCMRAYVGFGFCLFGSVLLKHYMN